MQRSYELSIKPQHLLCCLSSRGKKISRVSAALTHEIFLPREDKLYMLAPACNILYVSDQSHTALKYKCLFSDKSFFIVDLGRRVSGFCG